MFKMLLNIIMSEVQHIKHTVEVKYVQLLLLLRNILEKTVVKESSVKWNLMGSVDDQRTFTTVDGRSISQYRVIQYPEVRNQPTRSFIYQLYGPKYFGVASPLLIIFLILLNFVDTPIYMWNVNNNSIRMNFIFHFKYHTYTL